MAELVDAPDSKSGYRKDVQVRFLFWALDNQLDGKGVFIEIFLIFKICQQFASKMNASILATILS